MSAAIRQGCLLARKLTEAGAACVEVIRAAGTCTMASSRNSNGPLPEMDAGIGTLLKDLYERGGFQDTVVVTLSEFGRTIRVNGNAGHV